jgi:hypothetical protein
MGRLAIGWQVSRRSGMAKGRVFIGVRRSCERLVSVNPRNDVGTPCELAEDGLVFNLGRTHPYLAPAVAGLDSGQPQALQLQGNGKRAQRIPVAGGAAGSGQGPRPSRAGMPPGP